MKYDLLMPLVQSFAPYALFFTGAGIIFKIAIAVYRTQRQKDRRALSLLEYLLIIFPPGAIYIMVYVPYSFPGAIISGDMGGLQNVSTLIWSAERFETGVDLITLDILHKDTTIRAYEDEFRTPFLEEGVPVVLPPDTDTLLKYFVMQRGRFLLQMGEVNLNAFRLNDADGSEDRGFLQRGASVVSGGLTDVLRELSSLPTQVFQALGSMILAILVSFLLMLAGGALLFIANLLSYMTCIYTLVVIFIYPFVDPFTNGFWRKVGRQYLVLLLWKPVIILVTFYGFLLIEGAQLNAILKSHQILGDLESVEMVRGTIMEPGALYTPLGSDIHKEQFSLLEKQGRVKANMVDALFSTFGIMVVVLFFVIGIPAVLQMLVGARPIGGNLVSAAAGAASSAPGLIAGLLAKGGLGKFTNMIQGTNADVMKRPASDVPEKGKEGSRESGAAEKGEG